MVMADSRWPTDPARPSEGGSDGCGWCSLPYKCHDANVVEWRSRLFRQC